MPLLLVGSYTEHTGGRGAGLTTVDLDPDTGTMSTVAEVGARSPSYLAAGADCLTVFTVDGDSLALCAEIPTGRGPRQFCITDSAVVVADTTDDRLVSFTVQPDRSVRPTGHQLSIGSPACVLPL